jgi:hypothetical protein
VEPAGVPHLGRNAFDCGSAAEGSNYAGGEFGSVGGASAPRNHSA